MYTFGTLKLDRQYSENDIKRVVPLSKYGLDTDFYGGRVTCIGETGTDILLFLETKDGLKAIDTGAVSLKNIDIKFIRELAKKRKIPFNLFTSKNTLITLLGGDDIGEERHDAKDRHDDDGKGNAGNDVPEAVQQAIRQEEAEKEGQKEVISSKPSAKARRGRKPEKKPTERRKRLLSVDNEKQSGGKK